MNDVESGHAQRVTSVLLLSSIVVALAGFTVAMTTASGVVGNPWRHRVVDDVTAACFLVVSAAAVEKFARAASGWSRVGYGVVVGGHLAGLDMGLVVVPSLVRSEVDGLDRGLRVQLTGLYKGLKGTW